MSFTVCLAFFSILEDFKISKDGGAINITYGLMSAVRKNLRAWKERKS